MPSANSRSSKTALTDACVSIDEQARTGHSPSQQIEALRGYKIREGYEASEEVADPRRAELSW